MGTDCFLLSPLAPPVFSSSESCRTPHAPRDLVGYRASGRTGWLRCGLLIKAGPMRMLWNTRRTCGVCYRTMAIMKVAFEKNQLGSDARDARADGATVETPMWMGLVLP